MSNSVETTANNLPDTSSPHPPVIPPPPGRRDAEAGTTRATGTRGFGVSSITRRWKREDMIQKGSLVLRGLALLFSLLAFLIMASNKHGDWKNFDNYQEYRYLLAIAILSTLYNGAQTLRHAQELSTGQQYLFHSRTSAMVDFVGDQIVSYLLISAASSAVPLTNRMREGADNIFTDSSAASISMAFFAFFSLGMSALISGYKLSTQSYI